MSAKFSRKYCQCGEPFRSEAQTFCNHCGMKTGDVEAGDLSSVTGAVREFHENASEEKKEERYNQQKWKLFETNYQREKGITLDESLREIEEYQNEGTLPEPAPAKHATVGSKMFRDDLDQKLKDKEEEKAEKARKAQGGNGGGFFRRLSKRMSMSKSGSGSKESSTGSGAGGGRLQEEFGRRLGESSTNAGAAFFSQHMATEKKKFQPTYGMN